MKTAPVEDLSASTQRLVYSYLESPVGPLLLAQDGEGLRFVSFAHAGDGRQPQASWQLSDAPFAEVVSQLNAYFRRELRTFTLPLHLVGSDFQRAVWSALLSIPYGSTLSYGELARRIGRPAAIRAVGGANHANPIAIIVPCHRVIGSNGKLVGYGGGLQTKQRLLSLERGDLLLFEAGTTQVPGFRGSSTQA